MHDHPIWRQLFIAVFVFTGVLGGGLSWEKQARLYRRTQSELAKRNVSVRDRFVVLYRYVAEKNRQDEQRNKRLAIKCVEKADEQREESKSAKYVKAAKAFKRCADYNVEVWEAHRKGDSATMTTALEGIVKMESVITDCLGKCPRRDWLTPRELGKYIRIQAAKKQANRRG